MLHLLDDALEAYLRGEVPLRGADVDVVFARPDKEWGAAVIRPTVNLFLWDVRRNSGAQESGMEWMEIDGKRVRRAPQPRVDCRYMVTAWAGDPRDEHQLLGAVLSSLLRYSEMPEEYLVGPLGRTRPLPTINVPRFDGSHNADFWTAISGEMRPAVDLVISATFDAAIIAEAGPPVTSFTLGARRSGEPATREERTGARAPEPAREDPAREDGAEG
jgi:hypothetical protein